MELEWIIGLGVSMVVAGARLMWQQHRIFKLTESSHTLNKKLLEMHEHPDDYEFGTKATNKALESQNTLILKTIEVLDRVDRTIERNSVSQEMLFKIIKSNGGI